MDRNRQPRDREPGFENRGLVQEQIISRGVVCPVCAAPEGQACQGTRGPRKGSHAERAVLVGVRLPGSKRRG